MKLEELFSTLRQETEPAWRDLLVERFGREPEKRQFGCSISIGACGGKWDTLSGRWKSGPHLGSTLYWTADDYLYCRTYLDGKIAADNVQKQVQEVWQSKLLLPVRVGKPSEFEPVKAEDE